MTIQNWANKYEFELVKILELRELIDFWKSPSKYFVKKRLGLSLWEGDNCLSDNEPFQLDNLEKYRIKQELLEDELEMGEQLSPAVFQARGILPAGVIGELQLRSMRLEVQKLVKVVQDPVKRGKKDEPVDVDLQRKRRPGLQANVHQTEILVPKVVIEDALRHLPRHETRPTIPVRQLERVRHRAADQHRVRLLQQTVDHLDLVGNFRATQNHHERTRRILQFSSVGFRKIDG